jgi:hypothetical protein
MYAGRVLVTVGVTVELASWGDDCTIEQALKQAKKEAEDKIRSVLSARPEFHVSGVSCARVVIDDPANLRAAGREDR